MSVQGDEMTDFIEKYKTDSKRMKKAWKARQAKRAGTSYNLSLTLTDRDVSPGKDASVRLELVDIGEEAAQKALFSMRQTVEEGQITFTRRTAELLKLPMPVARIIK